MNQAAIPFMRTTLSGSIPGSSRTNFWAMTKFVSTNVKDRLKEVKRPGHQHWSSQCCSKLHHALLHNVVTQSMNTPTHSM